MERVNCKRLIPILVLNWHLIYKLIINEAYRSPANCWLGKAGSSNHPPWAPVLLAELGQQHHLCSHLFICWLCCRWTGSSPTALADSVVLVLLRSRGSPGGGSPPALHAAMAGLGTASTALLLPWSSDRECAGLYPGCFSMDGLHVGLTSSSLNLTSILCPFSWVVPLATQLLTQAPMNHPELPLRLHPVDSSPLCLLPLPWSKPSQSFTCRR